ncbi:MAG: DNA sulfur modification protein DndD, partial [Gammaproteobacteria bacterium]|nr:DNA sulfur modification protein DndD [Gammaproteobacteria bacterium]
MILDEITLYNFGSYSERQEISLTPVSSKKPVILLGGLNGGGKTTFLDALQLCLFGPHAKVSNRGSLAYSEYLSRSIHRGAETPEAAIRMSFRHTNEGKENSYNLQRFWHRINDSCKETFKVWKNGKPDSALAENWVTQVEDFVPPNIAHLFFFDGEQIEGYASYENSAELIGAAIQNLLGLDMVDQLQKDLIIYERRKRSETKNDDTILQIKEVENRLKEIRQRIDRLCQERASLQSHNIDRIQRAITRIEEEYRKLGGVLFDRRVDLEQNLVDANRSVEQNADAQREAATGLLPLLLVKPLLKSIISRDRQEEVYCHS